MRRSKVKWAVTALAATAAVVGTGAAGPVAAQEARAAGCERTGHITVHDADTGADLGYVSRDWNAFGENVTTISQDPADRMTVRFTQAPRFAIETVDGPDAAYPLMGGIVGFSSTDELRSGSYDYAYLGGTTATPLGSPPVAGPNSFTAATGIDRNIESAIWSVAGDDTLSAQWVNPDRSEPATHEVVTDGILILTGDVAVFESTFGETRAVVLTFNGTPPCAPPPGGCDAALSPAGCWSFGEASGTTALDGSGNGNDGTYAGGPVLGAPGVLGGDTAVALDGRDDHVVVPDSASLDVGDSFTLEGWIRREDDGKTHQLFNKGGRGFHVLVMDRFNGNQVWVRKAGVSTIVRTRGDGVPADGAFHHVVVTKDGPSSTQVYVDGEAQALDQVSPKQVVENTAARLFLSATKGGDVVAGALDEFAVYDRALTSAEVEGRFSRPAAEPVLLGASQDTASQQELEGGEPAGDGRCTDIGERGSGIDDLRVRGVDCGRASDLVVDGPDALAAAGYACTVTKEEFGATVRITRSCTGPQAARIGYVTVS